MMEIREIIFDTEKDRMEAAITYMAEVVGVVFDKDVKNPKARFEALLTEAVGNKPSSTFKFIPCTIDISIIAKDLDTDLVKWFGTFSGPEAVYRTSLMELLYYIPIEEAIRYIDFSQFRTFHCVTPYFIYGQLSTHREMAWISHSSRRAKILRTYFKPREIDMPQEDWDIKVRTSSPDDLEKFMKDSGVIRLEISGKGTDALQYRPFTMGGWCTDTVPYQFKHLLAERSTKGTQLETREFIQQLKDEFFRGSSCTDGN